MKYLFIFALALCFTNCTVEKRLYNKGYHIEWKHNSFKTEKLNQSNENGSISELRDEVPVVSTSDDISQTVESVPVPTISISEEVKSQTPLTVEEAPIVQSSSSEKEQTSSVVQSSSYKNRIGKKFASSVANGFVFTVGFALGPVFVALDVLEVIATTELYHYEMFDNNRDFGSSIQGSFSAGAFAGMTTVAYSAYPAAIYVPLAIEFGAIVALTYMAWLAIGILVLMLLLWLLFMNVEFNFPNFGWGH